MADTSSVGTEIYVSTTLPATRDEAGFEALTWELIGRPNSVPDLAGTYDVATFDDMHLGEEIKEVDMLRAGDGTFTVLMEPGASGHATMEAAAGTKAALKIVLKNGAAYGRVAIVTSFKPTGISVGNLVTAEIGLAFEGRAAKYNA